MTTVGVSLFRRSPEKITMKIATFLGLSFLLIASYVLICEAQHPGFQELLILEENMRDPENSKERSCAKPRENCNRMNILCCRGECVCPTFGDCFRYGD
uniref:Hainantoxin-XVII-2 n=1 Tax=Cyriopagopus hainanus TaxID=2781057 RepID=H17B1_CYRHA|nr:RecName: Full=Hainantoxin-XVII-2; Short=HNTX-XVII-2; Flags: Precursor [Haplopelma hainanum]ADB56819.1 HNTX-XVII-2 precursor [Haplopelma hainanum]